MVLFNTLIPVFALILLGYLVGWKRWVPAEAGGSLAAVTFKLLLPALLFAGLARADLEGGFTPLLILVYYVPALLIFAGVNLWAQHRLKRPTSMGLASSYSNNVLVGIPLVSMLLGPQGLVYLFAILIFHSPLLFAAQSLYNGLFPAAGGSRLSGRALVASLANPIIVGLLLGVALNLSGLDLPAPLWRTIDWLGAAALPCALLVLGLSLSSYRLTMSKSLVALTLVKLVVFPSMMLAAVLLANGLPAQAQAVMVIMAACPTGVNVLAFAMGGEDNRIISSVICLSTLAAVLTLPAWLWVLERMV
ncbi:AEC family transporter [Pseudomonas sp.]|uniref:AEC family transporter n=1 Tax=Pseudomonas sp. TaxID=306 RepID=UPI00272AD61B|nr:AEC family transporter [Pseudomonas sp.]